MSESSMFSLDSAPTTQLTVFYSSVSGNMIMKRKQQHIIDTLNAKKIPFTLEDVAASADVKEFLKAQSPEALALPQIWRGKEMIGLHEAFENALEGDYLTEFLGTTAQ